MICRYLLKRVCDKEVARDAKISSPLTPLGEPELSRSHREPIKYLIQIMPVWSQYYKEWRRDELRCTRTPVVWFISGFIPWPVPLPSCLRGATFHFYFIASLCRTHKPALRMTLWRRKDGELRSEGTHLSLLLDLFLEIYTLSVFPLSLWQEVSI